MFLFTDKIKTSAVSIEMQHQDLNTAGGAIPGDSIGILLRGVGRTEVKTGQVACAPDSYPLIYGVYAKMYLLVVPYHWITSNLENYH